MPLPVPELPPQGKISALVVGAPASATGAAILASAAAFVHGRATAPVIAQTDLGAHGGSEDLFVVYRRRKGVESLRVVAELNRGSTATSTATIAASLHAGAGSIAWHTGPGGVALDGGMDGSRPLPAPSSLLADYPRFEGYLDVSGLTAGALSVLKFTSGGSGNGLFSLHVSEVPVPALDPSSAPNAEPGVDASWTLAGSKLVDGSSGSPRGVGRILRALDDARIFCPRHWQVAAHTGDAWSASSASLATLHLAGGVSTLRVRARRLRETSSPNIVAFGAVYKFAPTHAGLTNCKLRLTATSVGAGTVETTDAALADTSGGWVYTSAFGNLPCDGTAQELELAFSAQTESDDGVGGTATDTVEIATLFLIEYES